MDKHLQPSGLNSDFHGIGLSFPEYIEQSQAMIAKARLDLTPDSCDYIIQANSPKQSFPSNPRYGVLLIHGLLDSPFILQDLFKQFVQESALVRTLLLPGHGTVPGDLCTVQLQAWRACIEQGVAWMQEDIDQWVIIGFSTGASLALELTLKNNLKTPLILLAPALKIQNPLAPLTGLVDAFGAILPSAKWVQRATETDYAKYRSVAVNAVYQVQRLTVDLKRLIQSTPCDVPVFIISSLDDEVVDVKAMQDFLEQKTNPASQFWLYGTPEKASLDPRIHYHRSDSPSLHILDYSHVSLMNAPDNPHYGIHGDFDDNGHYQTWWGKTLSPFKIPDEIYYGALTTRNLRQYRMHRLTYNPDFARMSAEILRFIHTNITIST